MKEGVKVWITNGEVAWELQPGRIARRFQGKVYQPPANWQVHKGELPSGWSPGEFGEMRRARSETQRSERPDE